jgi:predicted nucleic acid-binding protein
MIYLLDTNIITDWISGISNVISQISTKIAHDHTLALAQPIQYEVQRGLFWKTSPRKQLLFEKVILPRLTLATIRSEAGESS